jgi:hypothetical protein
MRRVAKLPSFNYGSHSGRKYDEASELVQAHRLLIELAGQNVP